MSAEAGANAPPSRRLFFALCPDAAVRARLAELSRQARDLWGGRRMREDTLHLTLAFLGEVSTGRLPDIRAVASAVGGRGFDLSLDRLACWQDRRIAWAGFDPIPGNLLRLVEDLAGGLRAAGLRLEDRPFLAHVTLLRNVAAPGQPVRPGPLLWRVREFALVESILSPAGARHEVVEKWLLAAG